MSGAAGMDITGILGLERDLSGNPARAARGLVRRAVTARIAEAGGLHVASAVDLDGSPLLLLPASFGEQPGVRIDYAAEPREPLVQSRSYGLTVAGELQPMREEPSLGRYIMRFCNRHQRPPESLTESGLRLFRLEVTTATIAAAGNPSLAMPGADYRLDLGDAPDHTQREWDNLGHQNYQHLDINEQLVIALLERPPGRWVLLGLDPEGMDFRLGHEFCRLPFTEAALTQAEMGREIKAYLVEARTRLGVPLKN
jgi:hypothetical protein